MAKLLSPEGRLVCIEFPTYKDPAEGGPPWALPPEVYEAHLSKPRKGIPYDDNGKVILDNGAGEVDKEGLIRVAHFKPERTFEVGKGTDWISVWRRR